MKVLAIYIEPAPYILDLIQTLRDRHTDLELQVLFITASASQPWGGMPIIEGVELLPAEPKAARTRIRDYMTEGRFDWLHLAGWGHPLLKAALRLGRTAGLRISMESDTQPPFSEPALKRWLKSAFYPRMFRAVDCFLPGGSRQKRYLQQFGIPDSKIRIAQMTVDVDRITAMAAEIRNHRNSIRGELCVGDAETLFVYVGRLEPWKGIKLLLEAFESLELADARLMVVGDGSCRPLVEKAAAEDTRIRFIGRRNFEGVVEAFAISDIAVIPSSFEPWGLVVNEALAAGTAVIASDRVGSVDDLVIHGTTGITFPFDDGDTLAALMFQLGRDAVLRGRLVKEGQRLISVWNLASAADIMFDCWRGRSASL